MWRLAQAIPKLVLLGLGESIGLGVHGGSPFPRNTV